MSEDDHEKNLLQNELKKKLDNDKKSLDVEKQELEELTKSFDADSISFVNDVQEIEKISNQSADDANELLDTAKKKSAYFIEKSKGLSEETDKELQSTSRGIKILFSILLGVSAAIFVGLYYFGNDLLKLAGVDTVIDPVLITGIIILICFVILVFKIFSSVDSKIISSTKKQGNLLSDLQKNTSPLSRTKIRFNYKKVEIAENFRTIGKVLHKVASGTQEYIPGIGAHYEGLALLNKQGNFALTMRNALQEYGLSDDSIDNKLRDYSNFHHDEEKWVQDVSDDLSKIIGVSFEILYLCYYDYEGTKNLHQNAWRMVQDNSKTDELIEILKIQKSPLTHTDVKSGPFVQIIALLDLFSISKFNILYDKFYNDFSKEKKLLIQTLRNLGFEINDLHQNKILDIFPISTKSSEWNEFLISETAIVLTKNPVSLYLLYFDAVGEYSKRDKKWGETCKDDDVCNSLVDFFISTNNYPDEFQNKDLNLLCLDFLNKSKTFLDIKDITKNIWNHIHDVQRTKRLFAYALESKKTAISDKVNDDYYSKLLVLGNVEQNIASELSTLKKLDVDIILLFYYDYIQDQIQRQENFKILKSDDDVRGQLAEHLLNTLIKSEPGNNEKFKLSSILLYSEDFILDKIRNDYLFYYRVYQDVLGFVDLLNLENIHNNGTLDIAKIITTLQNNSTSRYDALKKMSPYIIKPDQNVLLNSDQLEELVVALLVIYFKTDFDSAREYACKDASTKEFSIKLLYEWITRKGDEVEFGRKESHFQDIMKPIFNEVTVSFEHIEEFTSLLEDGKLATSIKALFSTKLKNVQITVDKINDDKHREILNKVSGTLNNILRTKITTKFVTGALKSQLISAYILTSREGSIMGVLGEYMRSACDLLAKSNPKFKNFLIMDEKDSEAGNRTRIGVVPLHIKDFEEYNELFQQAFEIAAKKFIENNPGKKESFTANLFRIIPSPLAFKQVLSNPHAPKVDPIQSVIDLVRGEEFDAMDRIKLAVSEASGESAPVVLKEILESIFNETNMNSFINDDLKNILDNQSKLMDILEKNVFAVDLRSIYDVTNTTDLAESLYLGTLDGTQKTEIEFNKRIESILLKHEIFLQDLERGKIYKSLFDNLVDITKFLRGKL